MRSHSRSRSSAPTPASRSPSGRRAAPCSSLARCAGIECTEYAPARVKQAVCGYGRAEKAQVQRMVKAILGLQALPTPNHAADALAVAICHALAPPLLKLVGRDDRAAPWQAGRSTPEGSSSTSAASAISSRRRRRAVRKADGADEVVVETYLHVREDALQLYGFAERAERELFIQLLSRERRRAEGRARDRLRLARRRAAPRDRARGRRALPGDPRHRQEDGRADRARAEGEARRVGVDRAGRRRRRRRRTSSRATRSSSSATRSSTPSARSRETDAALPPEERVRQALRKAA